MRLFFCFLIVLMVDRVFAEPPDFSNHPDADRLGREYAWKKLRYQFPARYTKPYCENRVRQLFREHVPIIHGLIADLPDLDGTKFQSYHGRLDELQREFNGCALYVQKTRQGRLFDSEAKIAVVGEALHGMQSLTTVVQLWERKPQLYPDGLDPTRVENTLRGFHGVLVEFSQQ